MARILIAEPSKTLAALVKLSLAELGAELEVAHDGASALAVARARVPDALVCDQGLPGLDGYALAHTVKQLAAEAGRPPVAALMLVPEHTTPDPERLAYVGIGDVLVKPFERAVLLERVRALLDARSPPGLPAPTATTMQPAPTALVGRATGPSPAPYATIATSTAAPPDLGPRLALELPALVDQAVQRLLPALVQAAVERAVAERIGPIADIAVQRALTALVTPATIERAVASEVQGAVGEIGARVEGQLEADLLARLDRFARETLPARLQTQAEQIIWKIVPTIAEDIVKDEIKRLTQEPS